MPPRDYEIEEEELCFCCGDDNKRGILSVIALVISVVSLVLGIYLWATH